MRRERIFRHQLAGHQPGEVRLETPLHVNGNELLFFGFRLRRQLVSFEIEVGAFGVRLRADRHIFTRCHGQGTGDQAGDTREQDFVTVGAGGRDADDQAGRRDDPVIGSEDCGAQPADPVRAVPFALWHWSSSMKR